MNLKMVRMLERLAQETTKQCEDRSRFLRKRLDVVLMEEAELLDQLAISDRARDRLAAFKPLMDYQYQCPQCIIMRAVQAPLHAVRGGDGVERLRCSRGTTEFEVDPTLSGERPQRSG